MDTDALFQKHTIEEIVSIEKKTRQNIEHKKEELRQMVGERYRDLIEAADTITDMKNSANNVMETISKMQELCQGMKNTFQPHGLIKKPSAIDKRNADKPYYNIGAQIKLLMDTPERVWSALEEEEYLQATCTFLLARHIHTSLTLDVRNSQIVSNVFPVVGRQWATISYFRATILQSCRAALKAGETSDVLVAECLCSILLLEDATPRQVFNEFLLARTTAVQEQLDSDSAGVKTQICHVMRMLTTTLHQIYMLFCNHSDAKVPCNMLMSTLLAVTEKREKNSVVDSLQITSISKKYLPDGVLEFRPVPRQQPKAIDQSTIQTNSKQWIETCSKTVSKGVGRLLSFIDTVKGVAAIRDEIWHLLAEDCNMVAWDVICESILSQKLSLWEQFLRPMFCARVKAIFEGQLSSAVDSSKVQIAGVLTDVANTQDRSLACERDLSAYVWCESSSDLPPNLAWLPVSQRSLLDSGTLELKARSYTPAVQSLCRQLDRRLRHLLEDAGHYIGESDTGEGEEETPEGAEDGKQPFSRFADRESVLLYLQSTCVDQITGLIKNLQTQLYACKQQLLNTTDVSGNKIVIDRILMLARFTCGLSELSPFLQKCVVVETEKKQDRRKRPSPFRGHSKVAENPKWAQLRQQMIEFSEQCYSAWIEYTCSVLVSQFETGLKDCSGEAVIQTLTKWDAIEIQEETEDGKSVTSTIRVPIMASWFVHTLFYNLCEEINRIGGHALQRRTIAQLANSLLSGMFAAYENIVSTEKETKEHDVPFTQNRALQVCFDVKFISSLLPKREDVEENKSFEASCKRVLDAAEAVIDPFDLDVFMPYMTTNLLKHTQRCQVMYGALVWLDSRGLLGTNQRVPSSGQQEQHNVLALTSSAQRFPLLPISGHSRSTLSTIVEPPKPKAMSRSFTSGVSVPQSSQNISQIQENSKSFLGQMSTIWFSNMKK